MGRLRYNSIPAAIDYRLFCLLAFTYRTLLKYGKRTRAMATDGAPQSPVPRELTLPGKSFPPSIPLIISSQDNWNSDSNQLETGKQDPNSYSFKLVDDAVGLLQTIDKPLAVLSICGPYRSGKSYFISRVLGSPGAFKLGHSMQACTRGIWMATTVLECQNYTTVLLDTEGIDAVGASETMAMSLLTLTTLLSSFLIYNSKKVPQKLDLDKMRCFSQLATSLLSQCGESITTKSKKAFFPNFLWLLRDVQLKMTDRESKELAPTEFLHTRILASESGELTNLGKSLVSLFPSLECATLPIPSIKREILHSIVEQQDKLKPAFNASVDALIQQILQKVSPKKSVDGTTTVNGKALAALAGGYVEAVNKPGALPDLDQGWQAMVRLELKEYSYKLVREYEREMEKALEGNLPMEERNLLRIHQQTLNAKKSVLKQKICRVNPLYSSDENTQLLLHKMEQDIVQWSEPSTERERKVTGGVLYQFTEKNYAASKKHCGNLLTDLIKKSEVQSKVQEAVKDSLPIDIEEEVSEITRHYHRLAIGPAASEVVERGLSELCKLLDILKKIPGRPWNVRVIGWGSDRVKLSWDPPAHNPQAVEEYVVYKRIEGGENWEEAVRTKNTKVLVKGLKSRSKLEFDGLEIDPYTIDSNTVYEFQVLALNSTVTGVGTKGSSKAEPSTAAMTTFGACTGATASLFLPYVVGRGIEAFKGDKDYDDVCLSESKERLFIGLSIAALPVSLALSPVTAPVLAVATAKWGRNKLKEWEGDLTED